MQLRIFIFFAGLFFAPKSPAQELFISTEPASNMPRHAYGFRIGSENFSQDHQVKTRTDLDLMFGFSADLMAHVMAHASNYYGNYGFNNYGLYAKYRLYTDDGFKSHFRLAAFAEAAFGKQRNTFADVELSGGNSGLETGLILTILENHLALSSTLGVTTLVPDGETYHKLTNYNFSLSAGYLVYPAQYANYSDLNFNLYAELLGKWITYDEVIPQNYITPVGEEPVRQYASHRDLVLDLAVGPQVIINSISRFDLAIRTRLISGVPGFPTPSVFLRYEQMFYH